MCCWMTGDGCVIGRQVMDVWWGGCPGEREAALMRADVWLHSATGKLHFAADQTQPRGDLCSLNELKSCHYVSSTAFP